MGPKWRTASMALAMVFITGQGVVGGLTGLRNKNLWRRISPPRAMQGFGKRGIARKWLQDYIIEGEMRTNNISKDTEAVSEQILASDEAERATASIVHATKTVRKRDERHIRDFWNLPSDERSRILSDPFSYIQSTSVSPKKTSNPENADPNEALSQFLTPILPTWAQDFVEWGIGLQATESENEIKRLREKNAHLRGLLLERETEIDQQRLEIERRDLEIDKLVQTIRLLQDQAGAWATERRKGAPPEMQKSMGSFPPGIGDQKVEPIQGLTAARAKSILTVLASEKTEEINDLTRILVTERGRLGAARRALALVEREERSARKFLRSLRDDDPLDMNLETQAARESLANLHRSMKKSQDSIETQLAEVNKTRKVLTLAKTQLSRLQEIIDDDSSLGAIAAVQAAVAGAGAEAGGAVAEFLFSTPAANLPAILKENIWHGGLNLKSATNTIWKASNNFTTRLGEGRVTELQETLRQLQDVYATIYVLLSKAGLEGEGGKDIGWLKRREMDGEVIPTTDGTNRFYEFYNDSSLEMPSGYTYLLVPGLLWEIYPGYFEGLCLTLRNKGLNVKISGVSGTGATRDNTEIIKGEIQHLYEKYGEKVVLIGHSKGGVDSAACLSFYHHLKPLVAGLVTVQTPYAGAPLAQEAMADPELREVLRGWIEGYVNGDWKCVEDLSYTSRKEFLKKNPLPPGLKVVSFHSTSTGASSTMLPLSAFHTKRYSVATDGLVVPEDAQIPGSAVVSFREDLPHPAPVWKTTPMEKPEPITATEIAAAAMASSVGTGSNGAAKRELVLDSSSYLGVSNSEGPEVEELDRKVYEKVIDGYPSLNLPERSRDMDEVEDLIESPPSFEPKGTRLTPSEAAMSIGRRIVRLESLLTRIFKPPALKQDTYKLHSALVHLVLEQQSEIPEKSK